MNFLAAIFTIVLLLAGSSLSHCQSFANLDFEHPILPLVPVNFSLPTSAAFPRWTVYAVPSNNPTFPSAYVGYDTLALDGGGVFLEDTNAPSGITFIGINILPIQGKYSVLLQGAGIPAAQTAPSIGQTGTVPVTAQSLTFFGNLAANVQGETLQVTFNGHNLPFSATGTGANYTIYGADISSYAGQTGQLLFTTPILTFALLDNIQFSNQPIPERSSLALFGVGVLLVGFFRRRNFSR